jgi:glycogen debranching enzyme
VQALCCQRWLRYPVKYPTACSPQAWATGAPLFPLRVLLGLDAREGGVEQHPVLPERIRELALRGRPGPAGDYHASAAQTAHA